ncbi:MAG: hypothetical protein HPY66_2006 [Firmicutes bacterium]|nr:hypothetical protein [Bacillota bacterium]MDI6641294.1 cupin domain-containing protein [Elusimicrobiota bacterium]
MKVVKRSEIDTKSLLSVLITKDNAGAENIQVGIGRIQVNKSVPEKGFSKHPTEEICLILKGKVRVETPNRIEYLNKGDIVFMPKDEEHRNTNVGDREAELLWVTSPPTL